MTHRRVTPFVLFLWMLLGPAMVSGQAPASSPEPGRLKPASTEDAPDSRVRRTALFLSGAAIGLLAHETGHLAFDVAFDADPRSKRVDFHGIPFFARTHRKQLSPRREAIVSSAGFWVQHATDEWGAIVLAPALLDTWRYFHPESKAAAWLSRGVKIGMVALAVR